MSKEEDKPQKRSLHVQYLEMKESLKRHVQLMHDGYSQYLYQKRLLTEFAKEELNELIELPEREPRN